MFETDALLTVLTETASGICRALTVPVVFGMQNTLTTGQALTSANGWFLASVSVEFLDKRRKSSLSAVDQTLRQEAVLYGNIRAGRSSCSYFRLCPRHKILH